jgi:hypothetical protein
MEEHLGSYVGEGSAPCSENIGGERIKWLLMKRKKKKKKKTMSAPPSIINRSTNNHRTFIPTPFLYPHQKEKEILSLLLGWCHGYLITK